MAEHRDSSALEGISDYAEGTKPITKDPLIMAMFSPNSVPQQSEVFECTCDMTDEAMDEVLYEDQFGNNTYEVFDEFFPDMKVEEMDKAHYEEQFGNNRYEKIATPAFSQLSHPSMLDDFEDSLPRVDAPNRDKDDCSCSICLEYYRDKDDCGCSICVEYFRGTGKAFPLIHAS